MINASLVAVIIRVAGLTEKPLGEMLTQIQPILVELVRFLRNIPGPRRGNVGQNSLYGPHICGEGPDYEALT